MWWIRRRYVCHGNWRSTSLQHYDARRRTFVSYWFWSFFAKHKNLWNDTSVYIFKYTLMFNDRSSPIFLHRYYIWQHHSGRTSSKPVPIYTRKLPVDRRPICVIIQILILIDETSWPLVKLVKSICGVIQLNEDELYQVAGTTCDADIPKRHASSKFFSKCHKF